jgi:hypothetical protein
MLTHTTPTIAQADPGIGHNGGPPLDVHPVVYSIPAAVKASGGVVSRTRIYLALGRGELTARKIGRRAAINAKEFHEWLASFPAWRPEAPKAAA